MTTAFQSNAFQNNAFQIDDEISGGKGDNERRTIFKPTGLIDRPLKPKTIITKDEVEDSSVAFAEEDFQTLKEIELIPVARMSMQQVHAEIASRLYKKIRTEEDEIILLLLMTAAAC